jgi:hypothetical protein
MNWELLIWIAAASLVAMAVLAVIVGVFAVGLFISNWRKVREDMDEDFRFRRQRRR